MNVVSFCWFRTNCPRNRPVDYYTYWWPQLAAWFPLVYPGWQMRWHVAGDQLDLVTDYFGGLPFVRIEVMPVTEYMSVGALWRIKPCWDSNVRYCAQNDCDAVPAPRERLCRQHFIYSGYAAHVIRDDPNHSGQMMAGLCCWRADRVRALYPTFEDFMAGHIPQDEWQYNQWYLLEAVWRRLDRKLTHLGRDAGAGPQDDEVRMVPKIEEYEHEFAAMQTMRVLDSKIPIMGGGMDESV